MTRPMPVRSTVFPFLVGCNSTFEWKFSAEVHDRFHALPTSARARFLASSAACLGVSADVALLRLMFFKSRRIGSVLICKKEALAQIERLSDLSASRLVESVTCFEPESPALQGVHDGPVALIMEQKAAGIITWDLPHALADQCKEYGAYPPFLAALLDMSGFIMTTAAALAEQLFAEDRISMETLGEIFHALAQDLKGCESLLTGRNGL